VFNLGFGVLTCSRILKESKRSVAGIVLLLACHLLQFLNLFGILLVDDKPYIFAFKLMEQDRELSFWHYRGPEHVVAGRKVFEYLIGEIFSRLNFIRILSIDS